LVQWAAPSKPFSLERICKAAEEVLAEGPNIRLPQPTGAARPRRAYS
jgi:hypothetical protein